MKKFFLRNLLILLIFSSLCIIFFLKIKNNMIDFEVYWRAGKRFLFAQQLYLSEDGHYILKYIPFFAFVVSPLSLFPLEVSKTLWFFLSIFSVILFFYFSLEIIPEKKLKNWIILVISGLTIFKFIARELDLGQSNILMGVLFLTGFYFLKLKKDFQSGLFLSFSFIAKPYSAISLPYLLLKKKFLPSFYFLLFIIFYFFVPSLFYGIKGNFQLIKSWFKTIFSSTPHLLISNDNVSVVGMFSKWLGVGRVSFILSIVIILTVLFFFTLVILNGKEIKSSDSLEISAILIFIPLLSPQGWDYVFLLSLPAIMIIINYYEELPLSLKIFIPISLILIGFSIFDLMGRKAYEKFMELSVITLAYFVIIFSLFYMRFKKIA